jgi:hypothetical protein
MPAEFSARLEADIANCGPRGWLDWTLDFRNMLVYRGRRFEDGQFLPRTPPLFGADGQPLLRARRVTHLPRDPGRSDIEVFVDTPWTMVLGEESESTLQGSLATLVTPSEGPRRTRSAYVSEGRAQCLLPFGTGENGPIRSISDRNSSSLSPLNLAQGMIRISRSRVS